jgi:hypothetical protein
MITKRIIPAMMIFLFLLWFVMPVKELSAQKNEVPEGMMPVTRTFTFKQARGPSKEAEKPGNKDYEPVVHGSLSERSVEFSPLKALAQQYLSGQDRGFASQENGNLVRLYMDGSQNTANAVQKQGSGNIMNLGIYGEGNHGDYLQQGSNNYIFDRIGSRNNPASGVTHKIHQVGSNLGITTRGIQTMDMKIKQTGPGMQLHIRGAPIR